MGRLPVFVSLSTAVTHEGCDISICGFGVNCKIKKCHLYHSKKRLCLRYNGNGTALKRKINHLISMYWPVRNGTYPVYLSISGFKKHMVDDVILCLKSRKWVTWIGTVQKVRLLYII